MLLGEKNVAWHTHTHIAVTVDCECASCLCSKCVCQWISESAIDLRVISAISIYDHSGFDQPPGSDFWFSSTLASTGMGRPAHMLKETINQQFPTTMVQCINLIESFAMDALEFSQLKSVANPESLNFMKFHEISWNFTKVHWNSNS